MFESDYEDDENFDEAENEECEKCGRPFFLCECDDADEDEILICHHCENRVDNEELGITFHVCEECAGAVCAECAIPVVDRSGEPFFICLGCAEKLVPQRAKDTMER
jgi:hypothetical protein